jgi:phosphate starvation-inducible protein PhoH and related proteins
MTANSKIRLTQKDFSDISLSKNQLKYSQSILENTITLCYGPAGSSKTFSACYSALKLFSKGAIKKIILTKPIQESGEKLGSLPGDINEKIAPFMDSFLTTIEKIIPKEKVTQLIREGVIEFRPLAYLRGSTFDESIMILDEAQNCDMKQLMLYTSRLGKESKLVIAGDVTQHDIAYEKVALPEYIDMIRDVKGVSEIIFTEEDIVRSDILKEIVKRYEKWKYRDMKPLNKRNNQS